MGDGLSPYHDSAIRVLSLLVGDKIATSAMYDAVSSASASETDFDNDYWAAQLLDKASKTIEWEAGATTEYSKHMRVVDLSMPTQSLLRT